MCPAGNKYRGIQANPRCTTCRKRLSRSGPFRTGLTRTRNRFPQQEVFQDELAFTGNEWSTANTACYFESDGLRGFNRHAVARPTLDLHRVFAARDPLRLDCPLTLPFVGQMRDRVFYQALMIAHTFLAHFDDPFCKPFTGCRGMSLTRKRTAGFLKNVPRRVKRRCQNRDRLWIKAVPKERNNRHSPSPKWRHRRSFGKTKRLLRTDPADIVSVCSRSCR
jgi:hypothetical protein